ncbi:hypothetical protein HYPDE_22908 [Hyphomicrobium denitrificans 1NES1]|uniref:Uncharacterized protein n=1 Tax=Hyphomicrobium denitrificans 1NES1 TaxID=670307 RepID=N0B034_9HYPH|nr:hypothetical protein HYPDE_22908 [Hyphomicrobium denitrificans 1NES1]
MLMSRRDLASRRLMCVGRIHGPTRLQGRSDTMKVDGYSSDELKSFHRILQAAMTEVSARRVEFPISDMIARLFEAADNGERDPAKLRSAILAGVVTTDASRALRQKKRTQAPRLPIAVASKRRVNRPILTLFPRAQMSTNRS